MRRDDLKQINVTNLTPEQVEVIDAMCAKNGESKTTLVKRLLAEEAEQQGLRWPADDVRDWSPRD